MGLMADTFSVVIGFAVPLIGLTYIINLAFRKTKPVNKLL
jgi:hypothetical protein